VNLLRKEKEEGKKSSQTLRGWIFQVVNELHYDEYFRETDFNSLEEQSFAKFYLRHNRTTNYNGSFPPKKLLD
jgi:hypothetical protein